MAKATRKYFNENFYGTETANIQPSEYFLVYGNKISRIVKNLLYTKYKYFMNTFLSISKEPLVLAVANLGEGNYSRAQFKLATSRNTKDSMYLYKTY